jgi:hypothetical protein
MRLWPDHPANPRRLRYNTSQRYDLEPVTPYCLDFGFIPPLHRYLEEHYGKEYVEWVKHSKKIVPFIY